MPPPERLVLAAHHHALVVGESRVEVGARGLPQEGAVHPRAAVHQGLADQRPGAVKLPDASLGFREAMLVSAPDGHALRIRAAAN